MLAHIAVPLLTRGRLLSGMFFVRTGTVYSSPDLPISEGPARGVPATWEGSDRAEPAGGAGPGAAAGARIAGALPPVYADRNRMLQFFSNQIGNAVKFAPEGGCIMVRAESVGDDVRFAVADTGPGLSAEHQRHLFQPFWHARRDGRQGAGLGLGIARGIVDKHGGRIRVESEEGAGTTVFFTLPAAEERRAKPFAG